MQNLILTTTKHGNAAVPLCKPGSAFAYLKNAQARAYLPSTSAASSKMQFSNQNRRPRYSTMRDNRRNSRSPGRSLSPGAHNVPHRHPARMQLPRIVAQEEEPQQPSVFSHDSTFSLCKKLLIYRMMGSNVFINHSLTGISASYKLLGTKLTNFVIENTAASVFTGGVTVKDLAGAAVELEERGIGTIGCYVVEGVRDAENAALDKFLDFSVDSVRSVTENDK